MIYVCLISEPLIDVFPVVGLPNKKGLTIFIGVDPVAVSCIHVTVTETIIIMFGFLTVDCIGWGTLSKQNTYCVLFENSIGVYCSMETFVSFWPSSSRYSI